MERNNTKFFHENQLRALLCIVLRNVAGDARAVGASGQWPFLSLYRAQHYINMPVQFRPKAVGKFEALLVIQTDEGKSVAIRLMGEALEKVN